MDDDFLLLYGLARTYITHKQLKAARKKIQDDGFYEQLKNAFLSHVFSLDYAKFYKLSKVAPVVIDNSEVGRIQTGDDKLNAHVEAMTKDFELNLWRILDEYPTTDKWLESLYVLSPESIDEYIEYAGWLISRTGPDGEFSTDA